MFTNNSRLSLRPYYSPSRSSNQPILALSYQLMPNLPFALSVTTRTRRRKPLIYNLKC